MALRHDLRSDRAKSWPPYENLRSATSPATPLRRLQGIFAPEKQIDTAWRSLSWKLWIDGQQVSLSRFGHADRWIQADGRNVVLREWSIILVGAKGRHSIRYRTRGPQGVGDTTWRFSLTKN